MVVCKYREGKKNPTQTKVLENLQLKLTGLQTKKQTAKPPQTSDPQNERKGKRWTRKLIPEEETVQPQLNA